MFLAITGGILVGGVGLAAIYDYVARRHGRNTAVDGSGPLGGKNFGISQAASIVHDDEFQHP
jgi:hypothetical protein